jgi:hypothetical protein
MMHKVKRLPELNEKYTANVYLISMQVPLADHASPG